MKCVDSEAGGRAAAVVVAVEAVGLLCVVVALTLVVGCAPAEGHFEGAGHLHYQVGGSGTGSEEAKDDGTEQTHAE